jgi:fatty-acyl-CoA synthase
VDTAQLTIARLLGRAALYYGDREIVTFGVPDLSRTTYAEFVRRVHRLAHVLASLGVQRGDRVATLAWNHQRHLELYFAIPSSGAVLHTVNLRLAPAQIRQIIDHADDNVIFIDADQVEAASEALAGRAALRVVVMGDPSGGLPDGWLSYEQLMGDMPDKDFPFPHDLSENETASICYSSATTGPPKGVEYTHRGIYLHTTALCMADTWALSEADTILPVVPMFHVNAWGIPFAAVWLGSRLVLPGPAPRMEDIADMIRGERVTFSAAVPTVWAGVFGAFEQSKATPADVRMLVSGGAPLPPALLDRADRLGLPLIHSYGMTEASPLVLVGHMKSDLLDADPAQTRHRRLRQGLLVPGLEMSVARDGVPVPWDGQTSGELLLRGPWIAEEYRHSPHLSAAFEGGWYHSGDVVDIDPEGYVRVVDRMSDLIKSGGEWISTLELESALSECTGVTAAAVVGIPDPKWDERPLAYVVADGDVTDTDIRSQLADRVPKWWVPETIVRLEQMPLTSVGKFDKRALRERSKEARPSLG